MNELISHSFKLFVRHVGITADSGLRASPPLASLPQQEQASIDWLIRNLGPRPSFGSMSFRLFPRRWQGDSSWDLGNR